MFSGFHHDHGTATTDLKPSRRLRRRVRIQVCRKALSQSFCETQHGKKNRKRKARQKRKTVGR